MKLIAATLLSAVLSAPAMAQGQATAKSDDIAAVAPGLDRYARDGLFGDVWKRPGLSPRDRSIVTLSTMIARGQMAELASQLERALDNGVKPAEISEIVTHLAFYSGFANATAAAGPIRAAFERRGIGQDQLPKASPTPLPLDEAAETQRATRVEESAGPVSPGLVRNTTDFLFRDLWLRPDLAPRDRSLVTVSSLIASNQVEQMGFHLNKAMDNGLTREQAGEVIAHIAFYAGWPNAFSAIPVARGVFERRGK